MATTSELTIEQQHWIALLDAGVFLYVDVAATNHREQCLRRMRHQDVYDGRVPNNRGDLIKVQPPRVRVNLEIFRRILVNRDEKDPIFAAAADEIERLRLKAEAYDRIKAALEEAGKL